MARHFHGVEGLVADDQDLREGVEEVDRCLRWIHIVLYQDQARGD
jgi:hypothetical protein